MSLIARRVLLTIIVLGTLTASSMFSANAQDDISDDIDVLKTQVAEIEATIASLETEIAASVDDASEQGDSPVKATRTPSASRTTSNGDGSSLSRPLSIGEVGQVGDFTVRVLNVNRDAETIVLAENSFNTPAPRGFRMIIVTVELGYEGTDTGSAFWGLNYAVVGDAGLAYTDVDDMSSCGVVPNEASDVPDMYPGGTAEMNICWQVPEEELLSLVMVLEPFMSFSDDRVFFSISE